MIEFRYNCFHMRPNLFCRPIFVCHMFYTKINQLLFIRIFEFAISVTPFAVFLIKSTISFFADRGIIKWHTAALTNQLPWRT